MLTAHIQAAQIYSRVEGAVNVESGFGGHREAWQARSRSCDLNLGNSFDNRSQPATLRFQIAGDLCTIDSQSSRDHDYAARRLDYKMAPAVPSLSSMPGLHCSLRKAVMPTLGFTENHLKTWPIQYA